MKTPLSTRKYYGLRVIFIVLTLLSLLVATAFIYGISEFIRERYPVGAMVPLDYTLRMAVYYTLFGMWLMFGFLFIALHFKVIDPITTLAKSLRSITDLRNWESRVPYVARIRELDSLVDDINQLVAAVENDRSQLHELSIRDALTGLLNRRGFEMRMRDEIDRAKRFNSSFSIVLVDLDNFKYINDTYGHPAGDMALRGIAERLQQVLRRVDSFARIGGDEFLIILPEASPEAGLAVANKLHHALHADLFTVTDDGSVRLPVTASIGVASYPRDGDDSTMLHQAVDEVLYKAKRAGKDCVVSLDNEEDQRSINRPCNLRRAVADGLVDAAFQPIVTVQDGNIVAYEALARILEDEVLYTADQFIHSAENAGLSKEIDASVFRKGIEKMTRSGEPINYKMFFNFSSASFSDREWMFGIPAMLINAGVDCGRVVIEITEREALPHIDQVKLIMDELRLYGIQFALDDFGSGFSSFSYVQQLQVDYLKIDGSFVRYLTSNPNDRTIVENIQRLAKSFGLTTVAEFVEDAATVAALIEIGVDTAQGHHFGKPEMAVY